MTRARFFTAATAWDEAGRPRELLYSNEWDLLALRCWFQSDGAERQGRDPIVAAFGDACERAYEETRPDWWGDMLHRRDLCDRCGERYRIENLAVCSGCKATICHRCIDDPKGANGNPVHGCGGEIVG